MGILLKLVHKIIGNSIIETKIELQGDMFIEVPVEKSDNFIVEKEQPIGKTEQLSSSEKPNNHFKIRYCCICGKQTDGGSVCSDKCYIEFEKL